MDTIFDKKDQYERIMEYVLPSENVYAVFDCRGGGTGFIGITDKRIMWYDQGVLIKSKTMVSIPYNKVIGIASGDKGGGL